MSDTRSDAPDGAPEMIAAELALGLLDGEERAAALRRVMAERDFAIEVETWRGHVGQLFDLWPEVPAPDGLLARIERSLDTVGVAPIVNIAPLPQRRWMWPAMTGLSSVAAAALLLVLVTRPGQPVTVAPRPVATAPVPATMLVAAIAPVSGGGAVTAVYDPASGTMRMTTQALADARRSAELWVIGRDSVPHSLGVMPASGGNVTVNNTNRARMAAGATLAVTLEPIGGSPTGAPTGPVVAKGALSQV